DRFAGVVDDAAAGGVSGFQLHFNLLVTTLGDVRKFRLELARQNCQHVWLVGHGELKSTFSVGSSLDGFHLGLVSPTDDDAGHALVVRRTDDAANDTPFLFFLGRGYLRL